MEEDKAEEVGDDEDNATNEDATSSEDKVGVDDFFSLTGQSHVLCSML